jgi:hypothetical protein
MTTAAQRPDLLWAHAIWVENPGPPLPPVPGPITQIGCTVQRNPPNVGEYLIQLDQPVDASAIHPAIYIYDTGVSGLLFGRVFPVSDSQWFVTIYDVIAGVPTPTDTSFSVLLLRSSQGIDAT